MTIKIKFEFDPSEDYNDYPRFCSTERWIISAKMHRLLPFYYGKEIEIEEKWLPVFVYERRARRRTKRGYVNVNVRYHAYFNDRSKTYNSYIKFIKDLTNELEKYRMPNEVTELKCDFSRYDKLPSITLHQKFFADEENKIKSLIDSKVRDCHWHDREIRKMRDKLRIIEIELTSVCAEINGLTNQLKAIDDFLKSPDPLLATRIVILKDFKQTINKLITRIGEKEEELNKLTLKEIKSKFYGILSDLKGHSLTKHEMIKLLLNSIDEEYRSLRMQLEEILNLAQKHLMTKYEEVVLKFNTKIGELSLKKCKLENEKKMLEGQYSRKIEEYEKWVTEEIKKNIV